MLIVNTMGMTSPKGIRDGPYLEISDKVKSIGRKGRSGTC